MKHWKQTIGLSLVVMSLLTLMCVATAPAAEQDEDAANLAARIDELIGARWAADTITPAAIADDAEFLRRVHIDIAGKIPSTSRVRDFLVDDSSDKRRRVVDELLESPGYIANFTNVWRGVMMPEVDADLQSRVLLPSFEAWLRQKLIDNTAYDRLVYEILTYPIENQARSSNALVMIQSGEATPLVYYQAKEAAPANLAAATARMFLGIRIECAQCHDHPFDKWKRDDFWSFAAFYAGIERAGGQQGIFSQIREIPDRHELVVPDTNRVVQASYLDGSEPAWQFRVGARTTLAEWVTSKDNPYFSRAAANRLWAHFFGMGIVNPPDDFSANNPPSHPELLDLLAKEFAEHDFDIKFLIRAITASTTYQRSSLQTDASQADPALFARMAVRGMTAEQFYASLAQAIGHYELYQPNYPFVVNNGNSPAAEFRELFANGTESPLETKTTILQALALMNGTLTASATELKTSQTLAAVLDYPSFDTPGRLEALFLATLSRKPAEEELAKLVAYVDNGGATDDPDDALGDVFWALLNSSEFMLNH